MTKIEKKYKNIKKYIDKLSLCFYNELVDLRQQAYGGVAQLARACGSYPQCRGFKSLLRYFFLWPVGQAVKTRPSHGRIKGSTPLRVSVSEKINLSIVKTMEV